MRKIRKIPPNFPYKDPTVPFITNIGGQQGFACTVEEKIDLLESHQSQKAAGKPVSSVFAVWPGKKRSDVFYVQPTVALKALKGLSDTVPWPPPPPDQLPPAPPQPQSQPAESKPAEVKGPDSPILHGPRVGPNQT